MNVEAFYFLLLFISQCGWKLYCSGLCGIDGRDFCLPLTYQLLDHNIHELGLKRDAHRVGRGVCRG